MDDPIDRPKAIKAIKDLPDCYNGFSDCYDKACIIGVLEEIPTIEAIPISFIENRITELTKERNKYEIGTPPFRFIDVKIYYYEMLMDEWRKENR